MVANTFVPGVGLANYAANPLLVNTYSRKQEIEADINAVETLNYFNFKPQNYIDFLTKAQSMGKEEGGMFSTHPTFEARINAVKEKYK